MSADLLTREPSEIVVTHDHRVRCEGVGGALGHPRVYLEMGAAHFVECPYCDRRFVLAGHKVDENEEQDPAAYIGAAGH